MRRVCGILGIREAYNYVNKEDLWKFLQMYGIVGKLLMALKVSMWIVKRACCKRQN